MKTTKEHYELFKRECQYWIDYFGLKDWDVFFRHKTLSDALAYMNWSTVERQVTISLSVKNGLKDNIEYELCRSAFHEVCEMLLIPMCDIAGSYTINVIAEAKHVIIVRLINTVFEEYWRNRQ